MLIVNTIDEIQKISIQKRKEGRSIGLVPTMGALHEGHASLIRAAHSENDFVVVSVFVNPTQFGPNEDLDKYPRTLENDCLLAEEAGADVLFAPSAQEMYPHGEGVWVEVTGSITSILCGASRPSHFRGVTTVVNKLFNIVLPDMAYFGQKDAQQAQVLRRMASDLFMPVHIRIMPIVRENDGLALSSRNVYLSPEERKAALCLSRSLEAAKTTIEDGEKNPVTIITKVKGLISKEPLANIDYAEIYSFPDLAPFQDEITRPLFIGLAVKIGATRLIDNIVI